MAYLALLLANPGREISALELTGGSLAPATVAEPSHGTTAAGLPEENQPALDERTIRQYRLRLEELHAVIERCDAIGDADGAVLAHTEQDRLLGELRAATGLSGRARSFPTSEEYARVSVGKAIRRAVARISSQDRELGALLDATVHTGRLCVYLPLSAQD